MIATEFRDERDWGQFHTGKNLAMSLNVEAAELLELFLWKEEEAVDQKALSDELADVLYAALLIADSYDIDLNEAYIRKMRENERKYPKDRFTGINRKYNDQRTSPAPYPQTLHQRPRKTSSKRSKP